MPNPSILFARLDYVYFNSVLILNLSYQNYICYWSLYACICVLHSLVKTFLSKNKIICQVNGNASSNTVQWLVEEG